jgi:hypothetical protein
MNEHILKEFLNFVNRIQDFNVYSVSKTVECKPSYQSIIYTFTKVQKTGFIKCEIIQNSSYEVQIQFQDENQQTSGIVLTHLKEGDLNILINTLKECEYRKENILHWYTHFNNF